MSNSIVSGLIKGHMDGLTSSEKKIARIILAEYPTAGLQPVAKLASTAKVSAPTVLRFVSKLGIDSYPEFQERLLVELKERHKSALEQYSDAKESYPENELLNHCLTVFNAGLHQSFKDITESEFKKFIDLLVDPKRRVHCLGGRFSASLANYLTLHLQSMRKGCAYIAGDRYWSEHRLLDMDKKDVVLAYDFRRYQQQTIDIVRKAHEQGAQILLISDRYLSPAAEFASSVLTVDIKGPSPFDSNLPAMALTESIIAGVATKLGDKAKSRMVRLEAIAEDFEAHSGI